MLHDFSVTCSYDEVLQFKSSAVQNTSDRREIQGLFKLKMVWFKQSLTTMMPIFHLSVAWNLLMHSPCWCANLYRIQPQGEEAMFPRINKANLKMSDDEITIHHYHGLRVETKPRQSNPSYSTTSTWHIGCSWESAEPALLQLPIVNRWMFHKEVFVSQKLHCMQHLLQVQYRLQSQLLQSSQCSFPGFWRWSDWPWYS